MLLFEWLSSLLTSIFRGTRRAVDVKRKGCGDKHTAVEYVDAFLFGGSDPEESDSPDPPV